MTRVEFEMRYIKAMIAGYVDPVRNFDDESELSLTAWNKYSKDICINCNQDRGYHNNAICSRKILPKTYFESNDFAYLTAKALLKKEIERWEEVNKWKSKNGKRLING